MDCDRLFSNVELRFPPKEFCGGVGECDGGAGGCGGGRKLGGTGGAPGAIGSLRVGGGGTCRSESAAGASFGRGGGGRLMREGTGGAPSEGIGGGRMEGGRGGMSLFALETRRGPPGRTTVTPCPRSTEDGAASASRESPHERRLVRSPLGCRTFELRN